MQKYLLILKMNLVIDSGNSNTKIGYFDSGSLKDVRIIPNAGFTSDLIPEAEYIVLSSVSSIDFSWLKSKGHLLSIDSSVSLPFKVDYKTPETLGPDRIAGVAGAYLLYPAENCLVINAGTCLTTDFIGSNTIYEGGSISPGINMRFKALNAFTARLPLVDERNPVALTGKSTSEAIKSGVLNGILAEVKGMIDFYRLVYPDCRIIITGGDSFFFDRNLKADIFVVPELVLIGLNFILEYNVSKA